MKSIAKNLTLVANGGDSDPDMDEALRRVQTGLAYLERDEQLAKTVADEVRMGCAA